MAQMSDSSDADSALGSDASSSDTTSIASSIRGYKYEYGRRYHAYQEGKYVLPNDEAEQDRLDLHHHIFRLTLGGRLYRSPIDPHVQRVFDYGTGTGIWSMDFADEHPSAMVTGTDLSPIQPEWVPANCNFLVEDVEQDWSFSPDAPFDFIHGRSMCGSVADFDALYRKCYDNLKPGAWLEAQEYEAWLQKIGDPEGKTIPNINKWQGGVDEASTKLGRRFNLATQLKQKLINAGFVNVHDDVYPVCHEYSIKNLGSFCQVPLGTWPKDKKLKALGMYQKEHMILAVEAFTLALFTRVLNWSFEECQILIAETKNEIRTENLLISYFHFIYGQKPPLPDAATAEGH